LKTSFQIFSEPPIYRRIARIKKVLSEKKQAKLEKNIAAEKIKNT